TPPTKCPWYRVVGVPRPVRHLLSMSGVVHTLGRNYVFRMILQSPIECQKKLARANLRSTDQDHRRTPYHRAKRRRALWDITCYPRQSTKTRIIRRHLQKPTEIII